MGSPSESIRWSESCAGHENGTARATRSPRSSAGSCNWDAPLICSTRRSPRSSRRAYQELARTFADEGGSLPRNHGRQAKRRDLDCLVIKHCLDELQKEGAEYGTVRGFSSNANRPTRERASPERATFRSPCGIPLAFSVSFGHIDHHDQQFATSGRDRRGSAGSTAPAAAEELASMKPTTGIPIQAMIDPWIAVASATPRLSNRPRRRLEHQPGLPEGRNRNHHLLPLEGPSGEPSIE
jgi:hypothetical protein